MNGITKSDRIFRFVEVALEIALEIAKLKEQSIAFSERN